MGTTEDSYGQALLRGVLDVVDPARWRILCASGGSIRSSHGLEAQRNVLYQVIDPRQLDALVLAGCLSHSVTDEELAAFCASWAPAPAVAMSVVLPGVACVRADNRVGMKAVLDHLLDDHRYERLAFIGGPRGQQEAELRREVFLSALEARGIKPEPRWMVDGDYTRASGGAAALGLLDAGIQPGFQAIVSANDSMALGACSALEARGLKAGRNYFITGFDDMDEAYFHDPPLTTVRQSAVAQAREAARLAMGLAEGRIESREGDAPERLVSTELVLRSSCGCPASHQAPLTESSGRDDWDGRLLRSWSEMEANPEGGGQEAFFARLAVMLEKGPPTAGADFWQGKLDALRRAIAPAGAALPRSAEDVIHRARRFCFSHESRKTAERSYAHDTLEDRMHGLRDALVTTFDIPAIMDFLERDLAALGYDGAWISLFDRPDEPRAGSTQHFAMAGGRRISLPASGLPFNSLELLPGGFAALSSGGPLFILEALYSREEHLGTALFSATEDASFLSGALRTIISASIHGALLLEERGRAERQLMESEKLASLGSLVAGVAHEISTPMGVALTGASFLQGRSAQMERMIHDGELKRSSLEEWLDQSSETAAIIQSNLQRAADLMVSFKQVAVDQAGDVRRGFDAKEYLEETLLSLRPQWKRRRVRVAVEGAEGLELDSYPGALAQIVTNLLTNALLHAFAAESEGLFRIVVEEAGKDARISFIDDGAGMDAATLERIFDPFFTTRRAQGGSGLGLHIVRNLARSPLGGSIACRSEPGRGSTFELLIPLVAP